MLNAVTEDTSINMNKYICGRYDKPDRILFAVLVGILFTLPWKNIYLISINFGPFPVTTPTKILGVILAIFWAVYKLKDHQIQLTLPVILLVSFLLWNIFSTLWAENIISALTRSTIYLIGTTFLYIIWDLCCNVKRVDVSCVALVAGGWITVISTFSNAINQVIEIGINSVRYGGGGYGGNNVAGLIVLIVPLAWYLLLRKNAYIFNRRKRWVANAFFGGYILIAAGAVLLTGSRQGFVAYGLCLLILCYITVKFRSDGAQIPYNLFWIPTFMIPISLLTLLPQLTPFRKSLANQYPMLFTPLRRIASLPGVLTSGDLSNRLPNWQSAMDIFLLNPLFGNGSGYIGVDNIFISTLSNLGIIGFLLLVGPLFILFRDNFRFMYSSGRNGHLLALLVVWLIIANLNIWGKSPVMWAFLGLIISHTYVRNRSVTGLDIAYNNGGNNENQT
jgi:hypothetical protein